jgi:hypothetical protein
MNFRSCSLLLGTLGLTALLTARTTAADEPPPDPTPKGVEVQTRGPVHEAFAQPSDSRPLPSVTVPKAPPTLLDELPPDQKPEGDNVQWLPGYWSWDEDTKDFLWVSGFWRVPPPNRQWVAGSWQPVEDGFQWVPGFWGSATLKEVDYLPPPPPSVESGPSTPAPDDNSIYAPGCWIYRETKYVWRPGFWITHHPNWVWIPAQYIWTPGGYIFVDGYWDHPLEQRGLLFAPVRVDFAVVGPKFVFAPTFVVQADFLFGALFVRPLYCHYFFGDFFEAKYKERGFVAWFDYRVTKNVFDPNFVYYRHLFRADPTWERGLRDLYAGRISGAIPRPPRTLIEQNKFIREITVNKTANVAVSKTVNITTVQNVHAIAPIGRINNTKVTILSSLATKTTKFEPHVVKTEVVTKEQRTELHTAVAPYREAVVQRHVVETKSLVEGHTPVKVTDTSRTVKIEVPKAPVIAHIERTAPLPVKVVPKVPDLPKHEERTIPAHEEPRFPRPARP